MKHTPGPWFVETNAGRFNIWGGRSREFLAADCGVTSNPWSKGNAALIAAAPEMAEALRAEEEADHLFDAADEYTHRAEGEGWLNDPTGSMHVTEAWDRARQARERAKELRRAVLSKAGG